VKQNKLTARQIRTPKDGTLGDGAGLYLRTRNGSSSWVYRYSYGGRVREMGLRVLGLVEARERAVACRAQVKAGVDPKADFANYQSTDNTTFRQAADRYLTLRADDWVPRQAQQWRSTLTTYADPLMGMPVDQITTRHVAACLTPIWREKHVTASRVRERIERVLSASIALSERDGPNPATWRDNLETILGKPRRQVKHHPAVPVAEAPDAFARLWHDRDSGQGVRAVLLVALTGLRSGEVRNLLWDDIDGDTITIPPERMKARREHRLPMVGLLADWPRWASSPLILPNSRGHSPQDVTPRHLEPKANFVRHYRHSPLDNAARCMIGRSGEAAARH
jgi:integrase